MKKLYYCVMTFDYIQAKSEHCIINKSKIMNIEEVQNIHTVNGKLFSGYNVRLCLNDVDIKTLKLLYNIKGAKLNWLMYFEGKKAIPKYLKDNINTHYKRKTELSILKETEENLDKLKDIKKEYSETKKKVNAHYGMCATRPYKENLKYIDSEFCTETKSFADIRHEMWLDCYIAYYCTSYSRYQLAKYAAKYPKIVIQYDTDSLYFLKDENGQYLDLLADIKNENRKIIELNKRCFSLEYYDYCYNMGTWEIDNGGEPYSDFMILGAKRYIKTYKGETTAVIAGLPKETLSKWTEQNGKTKEDIYKYIANAVTDTVKFTHQTCGKLSSKYYDTSETTAFMCTDYLGNTVEQKESCYHALLEIGFEFTIDQMLKYRHNLYIKENTPH